MSKYYDYFQEQEHNPDEVTMDEFIAEAMRRDFCIALSSVLQPGDKLRIVPNSYFVSICLSCVSFVSFTCQNRNIPLFTHTHSISWSILHTKAAIKSLLIPLIYCMIRIMLSYKALTRHWKSYYKIQEDIP